LVIFPSFEEQTADHERQDVPESSVQLVGPDAGENALRIADSITS
jgi:hypothetical protein